MMLRALAFVLLIALSSAFTARPFAVGKATPMSRSMFSTDEEGDTSEPVPVSPLKSMDEPEEEEEATPEDEASQGMVVKNRSTGEVKEVKWVDPAMSANTGFQMGALGYALLALPVILFANDALHFIPTDGPLAFLNNI